MKILRNIVLVLLVLIILIYIIIGLIPKDDNIIIEPKITEVRGIFISYIDYSNYKSKDEKMIKEDIENKVNNIKNMNLNTIFLQVRAFADAIYPSKIFPLSKVAFKDSLTCDILKIYIEEAHKVGIKVHAWINPYRISNNNSVDEIDSNAIYKDWLSSNKIEISKEGIYFNPSDEDVLRLILDGIKEIVNNYDIDGVMYDDYFYPNDTIDIENYTSYRAKYDEISIEDYRRNIISNLIKESYNTVKSVNKDVLFGISPAGNIDNNMNEEYLDIKSILKDGKVLDYVMPQLYYGLNNGALPFNDILKVWNNLIKTDTKLYVALALYKSGNEDKYAKEGINEWIYNDDIIKKEIILSRGVSNYYGFGIYRYDFLFSKSKENKQLIKERENIKELLNSD